MKYSLIVPFLFLNMLYSQQYTLTGKVSNRLTGENLSFANVYLENTYRGTSANIEGEYQLKLNKGKHSIIYSFIGFKSDTVDIVLSSDRKLNMSLVSVSINLPEITVIPGENPAVTLVKNALERKKKRSEYLKDYSFDAYTKTIVKTTKDISANKQGEGLGILVKPDTGELKITAILENNSKGYYKAPDYYKDIIDGRKQSANFPPGANLLAGGRVLIDFYGELIDLVDRPLTGPLADDALEFYYYQIEDTLAIDNINVFKLYFEPIDSTDPGLRGNLFITDKTYDLAKVNVGITETANPMSLFTELKVMQQFIQYNTNLFMPIDYRIFAEGNFMNIAKFGFEMHSIFNDYRINLNIPDDFFDYAIVTVKPDADEKDSTYWASIQSIPNTLDETEAYTRIDSLEAIPVTFWDNFSFLSGTVKVNRELSVTGPLDIYGFNRIEGHSIKFGFDLHEALNKRLYLDGLVSYGFSDRKFKKRIDGEYLLGSYRTTSIRFKAFDNLTSLFSESNNYGDFFSSVLSLLSKYDFRDYYYTRGGGIQIKSEVLPFLSLNVGYNYLEDRGAVNNTNFSIFKSEEKYRDNKPIINTNTSMVNFGFNLDFRSYIENGYRRIRSGDSDNYVLINGSISLSNDWVAESDFNFETYRVGIRGGLRTFKSATLGFNIKGIYTNGTLPYHLMYALPGNIESFGTNYSFRTLSVGEVFGDKVITVGLEHDFHDELFRGLKIPFLKEWGVTFGIHVNAAWLDISDANKTIMPVDFTTFKTPFYEAGFEIGQRDFPMSMEFTWRLNHFGGSNFAWGVNVFEM